MQLSASRLITFDQCQLKYHYSYNLKLPRPIINPRTALGLVIHKTLEIFYQEFPKQSLILPTTEWLEDCYQRGWRTQREKVTNEQYQQLWQSGWQGLLNYYYRHISTDGGETGHFEQPFLIEQRFRARVMVNEQWITLRGQFDRLDWLDHNRATLRLVEYKTAKAVPTHNDRRSFELQLGFYQWAIEELYGYGLREMSLHYILAGQEITYHCTTAYREKITAIAELVVESQDKEDEDKAWQPEVGAHCSSCDFHRYCNAANPKAQTPPIKRKPKQLKLF